MKELFNTRIEKAIFEMNTKELIITSNKYINDPFMQKLIDFELINRGEF